MTASAPSPSPIREYDLTAKSSGVFGRVALSVRQHKFLIDGPVQNGCPGVEMTPPRFRYGIRICPEPVHWGGLSGCTYSEGVSWGKFIPVSEGGEYAEVYADATVAWPLLVRGVIERLMKR